MPANAIAPQTTAANSADIVVTTTPIVLGICTAAGGVPSFTIDEAINITRKNAAGTYDATNLAITPASLHVRLDSPGTYRAEKPVTRAALGVNQD